MAKFHDPALLKESIFYLDVQKGKKYIDATVGGGGHAELILKNDGLVLGIDCDPEAIKAARRRLSQACPTSTSSRGSTASWRLAQDNFARLKIIAEKEGFFPASGVLFDLGVSTYQIKSPHRGFSFDADTPLDMRMDPDLKVTAADLVNGLNKGELNELFSKLGEESNSWHIAESICRARRIKTIKTCRQLSGVIVSARPRGARWSRIHPATRCFLALRIAVNDELNNLKKALPQAVEILEPGGKLVVISFHSLEDRIVKKYFREMDEKGLLRIKTDKPIRPSQGEIEANPKSRSAKLRAAEKIK